MLKKRITAMNSNVSKILSKGSLLKNVRGEHNYIIFTSDIGPSFYRYFF